MKWESAALSDQGRRRPANEDSLLLLPERGVMAVADGMGGHVAGEIASGIAIATLRAAIEHTHSRRLGAERMARVLVEAVRAANAAIRRRAGEEPDKSGMGTTMTALALVSRDHTAVVAHVGDSRAYRLRGRELRQITRDHTWVQEQVDAGLLTPAQARVHAFSNILTQALGTETDVGVDVVRVPLRPGDRLLLCSDGLTGMLEDDAIRDVLLAQPDPQQAVTALIEAANRSGGIDNITALLTRITRAADRPDRGAPRSPQEAPPQST